MGMFKNGPLTGILGVVLLLLTWINQIFVEQGIPKDGKGWIALLMGNAGGLVALFAKDYNKSNSPIATAEAHTVPEVDTPIGSTVVKEQIKEQIKELNK